jgi:uncharacterized protein (TIGR02996 family)
VTTEDDFQNRLDDQPEDWQTRMVFADWLEERGDPRAEGYRALAAGRYVLCDRYPGEPVRYIPHEMSRIFPTDRRDDTGRDYHLPRDWYGAVQRAAPELAPFSTFVLFPNRRAAEDAAATAFAALPAERRAKLLQGRQAEEEAEAGDRQEAR